MPRLLSYVVVVAMLAVANGNECSPEQPDTCEIQDETSLVQTRITYHKHRQTKMRQVLTDLEEMALATPEGPAVLQDLLQGVMALPSLKTQEDMRAAVSEQPELQELMERYPEFGPSMTMLEDPQTIEQIKAAVIQEDPSVMKMLGHKWQDQQVSAAAPAKQKPSDVGLLEFSRDLSAVLVWTEGWGCQMNFSFITYPPPYNSTPEKESVFGPGCAGSPNFGSWTVDLDKKGVYGVQGNYSSSTYQYEYKMIFKGEAGNKVLGTWPTTRRRTSSVHGSFDVAADTFYYLNMTSGYPAYSWSLMGTSMSDFTTTTLISKISYCYWPSPIPATVTRDVIIRCDKNWNNKTDTYKLIKYSLETKTTEIMSTSSAYFSAVKIIGSKVAWSHYEKQPNGKQGYSMYSCDIASCVPELVGEMEGFDGMSITDSAITESGEVIWARRSGPSPTPWHPKLYNLTVTNPADGTSKQVMKPFAARSFGGFQKPTYLAINPLPVLKQIWGAIRASK